MQALSLDHGWNHDDVEVAVEQVNRCAGRGSGERVRRVGRVRHERTHAAAPIGAYTTKGAYSFVSAPRLHPPKLQTGVKTQTSKLAKGYFLVDNFPNLTATGPMTGEGGPLMMDAKLQPVWAYPVGTDVTSTNLSEQTYNGKQVLLWWTGVVTNTGASTSGQVNIVDQQLPQGGDDQGGRAVGHQRA